MKLFKLIGVHFFAALLLIGSSSAASAKSAVRPGFAFRAGQSRIVLMRPTVRVGAQSAGGVVTPNADWTTEARQNIAAALREGKSGLGLTVVDYDEGDSGDGLVVAQHSRLFAAVADAVIEYQFFPGNRLPTKKRKDQFEWGLGGGLAGLRSLTGADYALFVDTYDAYGSASRKLLQFAAAMGGISVTSGVHLGHAGLVDLRTGELVWLNADAQMGGDVRAPDGAAKRVAELLRGFPAATASSDTAAAASAANETHSLYHTVDPGRIGRLWDGGGGTSPCSSSGSGVECGL